MRDKGRHVILKTRRPLEEWVFEVELAPGDWGLLSAYFPKWNHPRSKRAKFLRAWLAEDYRPEILSDPKALIKRAAELKIRVSFDSDPNMSRSIISATPTTKTVNSLGV